MANIRYLIVLVLLILAAGLLVSCVPIPPYDPVLAQFTSSGERGHYRRDGRHSRRPLSRPVTASRTCSGRPARRDTHPGRTDQYTGDACPSRTDQHARDCDDHAGQSIGCPGAGGATPADAPVPTSMPTPTASFTATPAPTFTPRPTSTAAATPTRAPTMTRAATSTRAPTPTATVDQHLIIITEDGHRQGGRRRRGRAAGYHVG